MATLADIISADLGSAANDFKAAFTWGSNSIEGYISTLEVTDSLETGGFKPEYRANLFVQKSQFTGDGVDDPTTGNEIVISSSYDANVTGKKFRIGEITISDNATLEYELTSLSD
tara:strand:+ start:1637 stop:1981 length:345 start_codon:yes stop_codon:yes gene_type:complete